MNLLSLLKGKKVNVMTDAMVAVTLTIKSIKEQHHSEDLAPATPENDWWPPSRNWKTYDVTFTNGFTKSFNSLDELEIAEEP